MKEFVKPDVFWYEAATQCGVGANILGLVAAQAVLMHYVEIRRWRDVTHPGSVDKDPLFNFSLASHEVGYPGGIFAPFVPGNLDDLKKKEIKNGRLAMLSFVGFVMAAQVNGKGPLACLEDQLRVNPHCAICRERVYDGYRWKDKGYIQALAGADDVRRVH